MNDIKSAIKSPLFHYLVIGAYLSLYLTIGFYTELRLTEIAPIPDVLFEDFQYYERALFDALDGKGPYALRSIGLGYLYPPPALLIVDIFSHIPSFFLKVSVYSTLNIVLLVAMVYGIAKYYGYSITRVWYWYVLCLGFAPFLELLHIGQINMITLFGIFLLFLLESTSPILSGAGVGLAAITKVTPLLLFGYLTANRRFKVMVATVAVIAIVTCLSIWRYGLLPVLEYPGVFRWLLAQFPLGTNSQSLVAKLAIANTEEFQRILSLFPQILHTPLMSLFTFFTYKYRIIHRALTLYVLLIVIISCWLTFRGKQPREPSFIISTLAMMLSPNVMWYHHYVFMLLPLLIWMGWSHLDRRVVIWCLTGLLIVQFDRYLPPYGLLIHVFGHFSLLIILVWQIRWFYSQRQNRSF